MGDLCGCVRMQKGMTRELLACLHDEGHTESKRARARFSRTIFGVAFRASLSCFGMHLFACAHSIHGLFAWRACVPGILEVLLEEAQLLFSEPIYATNPK